MHYVPSPCVLHKPIVFLTCSAVSATSYICRHAISTGTDDVPSWNSRWVFTTTLALKEIGRSKKNNQLVTTFAQTNAARDFSATTQQYPSASLKRTTHIGQLSPCAWENDFEWLPLWRLSGHGLWWLSHVSIGVKHRITPITELLYGNPNTQTQKPQWFFC